MIEYDIYYMNHRGIKLNLVTRPYFLQTGALFDSKWGYESIALLSGGSKIKKFFREMRSIPLTLSIDATDDDTYVQAVNHFHDATDIDVINSNPGRLYVGDYYLLGFFVDTTVDEWEYGISCQDRELNFLVPNPVWRKDVEYRFFPIWNVGEYEYLDMPYDMLYDLYPDASYQTVNNKYDKACEFTMTIQGPVSNPSIIIGNHLYEVLANVYDGEYMLIDSEQGTVKRITNNGTEINLYNSRNKQSSLFQKIPPGMSSVSWNQTFNFNIILHQERSEPEIGIYNNKSIRRRTGYIKGN